jgi:nitrous oxide reductase accessory protein NosL
MMRYSLTRRTLLKSTLAASLISMLPSGLLLAGDRIDHPVKGGIAGIKPAQCPNCGMSIQMWGRTRHTFQLNNTQYTSCSIHCLADMARNEGQPAEKVQVALYLKPETLISANKAIYVVGSDAPGTMTMRSKLAFADQSAADAFIKEHGGMSTNFAGALAAATDELDASYKKTENKRIKKGKIVEPGPKDRCPVCGMYPARYPRHHSQVKAVDGATIHFCSTQCLVTFKAEPARYLKKPTKIKAAWVQVYPEGGWEYGGGLYYLVGSSIIGPMGPEALPFRQRQNAAKLAREKGGKVYRFPDLTPDIVLNRQ